MEDLEFVAQLGAAYERLLRLRSDAHYTVNKPQMEKLVKCIGFFDELAKETGGEVLEPALDPREESGDVIARFPIVDLHGDRVSRFAEIFGYCSAVGIDPTDDNRVEISCTIPDVFVPLAN